MTIDRKHNKVLNQTIITISINNKSIDEHSDNVRAMIESFSFKQVAVAILFMAFQEEK